MAGALQGLQNQCAFLMVVNAVYSDFVMHVQVVQYFFWQQSHVVISLCSGEALHFEQGISPSFLPLTVFNYYPNFLIISWDILLIKCSKCWSLQRLASIVQFLSDFQIPLLSLTCEKKEKENHWYILWFVDFCPVLGTKIFSFSYSTQCCINVQTLNHISTGNFKNSSAAKYPTSSLVLHNPIMVCFLLIYSSVLHCTTQDPSIKFHPNPFITFWVVLSTDRQTNKETDKPTLPKT